MSRQPTRASGPASRSRPASRSPGRGNAVPLHDALGALRAEHRNFQRLMRLFESQLAVFTAGDEPDYELMRDVMRYMVQFPDRFHHPREDVIFERLRRIDPSAKHAVESMLGEHEDMAARASELLAALEQIATDAMFAREAIGTMARNYLRELGEHIRKEETALFPLAERRLSATDWQAVAAQSRAYEDPLFGPRVAPGYRALFRRLAEAPAAGGPAGRAGH